MKRISYYLIHSLIIISLGLFSLSCSSEQKNAKENSTSGNSLSKKDSVHIVTGNKKQIPEPRIDKWAPGTAGVFAKAVQYNVSTPLQATLLITRVDGYGSSTPSLVSHRNLKVDISRALLNQHPLHEIKEIFTSSDTLSLVIRFTKLVGIGGNSHKWTIISLNQN